VVGEVFKSALNWTELIRIYIYREWRDCMQATASQFVDRRCVASLNHAEPLQKYVIWNLQCLLYSRCQITTGPVRGVYQQSISCGKAWLQKQAAVVRDLYGTNWSAKRQKLTLPIFTRWCAWCLRLKCCSEQSSTERQWVVTSRQRQDGDIRRYILAAVHHRGPEEMVVLLVYSVEWTKTGTAHVHVSCGCWLICLYTTV